MEEPVAPGEAIPAEPAAPAAPVEPAAPAWAGPSQEQWDELHGAVSTLAQLEHQRASVYQPQQPGVEAPNLWDDPEAWLEHKLSERLAPVQQFQQDAILSEAEERAMDILHDLGSRDGEFDTQLARLRAESLLPGMQQRYGPGPKAAQAALEQAAADQRAWEQQRDERAVSRHTNQIATLAGAPGEPGSTYAQGVQSRTMPDYRKGGSVTEQFFGGGER